MGRYGLGTRITVVYLSIGEGVYGWIRKGTKGAYSLQGQGFRVEYRGIWVLFFVGYLYLSIQGYGGTGYGGG